MGELSTPRQDEVVLWTGGAYENREGIAVTPSPHGLLIEAWYDGGTTLEGQAFITWERLEDLKRNAETKDEPK